MKLFFHLSASPSRLYQSHKCRWREGKEGPWLEAQCFYTTCHVQMTPQLPYLLSHCLILLSNRCTNSKAPRLNVQCTLSNDVCLGHWGRTLSMSVDILQCTSIFPGTFQKGWAHCSSFAKVWGGQAPADHTRVRAAGRYLQETVLMQLMVPLTSYIDIWWHLNKLPAYMVSNAARRHA